MIKHFHRYLSNVPRWSLLPLHHKQNVAEHSFYVTLYVRELLNMASFSHMDPHWKFNVLEYAVLHDVTEARTSDIPGPVKRSIKDPQKYEAFETSIAASMGLINALGQKPWADDRAKAIVKLADLTEELLFLTMEEVSGNRHVKAVVPEVLARFHRALDAAPLTMDDHAKWNGWVETCRADIASGVVTPDNSDDLQPTYTHEDIPF